MPAQRALLRQTTASVMQALQPLRALWHSLDRKRRAQSAFLAVFVALALNFAFVLLPALDTRKALSARLPQLEMQLATMRSQANDIAALSKDPPIAAAPRIAADVASLQSLFGPGVQISAAQDGFRIVMPSITYANWWDKTGDAMSRYSLVLREADLTRIDTSTTNTSMVAVDMRLGTDARVAGSPAIAATVQGN